MQVDQQNETENNHSQNEHNTQQVNAIFKKKDMNESFAVMYINNTESIRVYSGRNS